MIGERLLLLRKKAELTQDELAAILKINKHSISSYERDKSEPPDAIKIEIASDFNVSVDYLIGLTDIPRALDDKQISVRLPADFPRKEIKNLSNYIDYLMYNKDKK